MKFTLSWLKDHLDTAASLETVAETLTRIGLEVERVEDKAAALKPYVIARVELAEGPRLLTNIVGCETDDVRIDMAVEVDFVPAGEGAALYRFRPVGA